MNDRQRDLFLWQWSRRRQRGRTRVALTGAVIGAVGGLLFAALMITVIGGGNTTEALLAALTNLIKLLVLAVPAFGWLGFLGATRVFDAHEAMYQAMLANGARIPDQAPVLRASDRGPAIAVAIACLLMVAAIVALFVKYG